MRRLSTVFLSTLLAVSAFACAHAKPKVIEPAAPTPVAQPAPAPAPTPAPANDTISAKVQGCSLPNQFDDVYFTFDSYELTDGARQELQAVADCLSKNPNASIEIAGNTDARGTIEYNLALGQERARIAHDYLVRLGVDDARVKAISYGKLRPAVPGDDESAWSKNRRDEINVMGSH